MTGNTRSRASPIGSTRRTKDMRSSTQDGKRCLPGKVDNDLQLSDIPRSCFLNRYPREVRETHLDGSTDQLVLPPNTESSSHPNGHRNSSTRSNHACFEVIHAIEEEKFEPQLSPLLRLVCGYRISCPSGRHKFAETRRIRNWEKSRRRLARIFQILKARFPGGGLHLMQSCRK